MKKVFFNLLLIGVFVIVCYIPKLNAAKIECKYTNAGTYSFNFNLDYSDENGSEKVNFSLHSNSKNINSIPKEHPFSKDDFINSNGKLVCPDLCMQFSSGDDDLTLKIRKTNDSRLKFETGKTLCSKSVKDVNGKIIKALITKTSNVIEENVEVDNQIPAEDGTHGTTQQAEIITPAKKSVTQINLCSNLKFLEILKYIRLAITIIKIVVPIILLVVCSITLVKGLTAREEKELSDIWNQIKNKVIAALLVFLVPTIITMTLDIIGGNNNCYSNASDVGMAEKANSQIQDILNEGVHSGNIINLQELLKYDIDESIKNEALAKIEEYNATVIQDPITPVNPPITASSRAEALLQIAAGEVGNANDSSVNWKYTFGMNDWKESSYGWCSSFVTYCLYVLDTTTPYDIPFILETNFSKTKYPTFPAEWFTGGSVGIHWPAPVNYARKAAYDSSNDTYFTNDNVYYAFGENCYNMRTSAKKNENYGKHIYGYKDGVELYNETAYIPKKGDIMMFFGACGLENREGASRIDHIGIVESVNLQNKTVTIIDGNSKGGSDSDCGSCNTGSCVCRGTLSLNDGSINGYVVWE